jgi:hypothetical protein
MCELTFIIVNLLYDIIFISIFFYNLIIKSLVIKNKYLIFKVDLEIFLSISIIIRMPSQIQIQITVKESDLHHLGYMHYQNDMRFDADIKYEGGMSFLLSGATWNVEYIMLRSIIEALGYELSEPEDWLREDGECDMLVLTTYPWSVYSQ